MKNVERAKNYQKQLYNILGREWSEASFKRYWEGGIYGNEWDSLYDQGLLNYPFCAWCGNDELKSGYYRSPKFSMRGVRVPICDDCFNEASGGNVQFQNNTSKSGCFIATAVLGDPLQRDVFILRKFRDDILLNSFFGKIFIHTYYLISLPLANIISKNKFT